ncbi:MAG: PD-(D/E)XK nuclease family protein, partial [Planctomycetia bacterium]|nr:PD-(D/E)XK nuclease family protein [Planctomycetia bacterium]
CRFSALAELVRHPDLEYYINLAMPVRKQSAPTQVNPSQSKATQLLFDFEDVDLQEYSDEEMQTHTTEESNQEKDQNVCDWLTLLDRYQREFFPEQLDDLTQAATTFAEGVASKHMTNYADLATVFTILDDLFKPFYQNRPDGTSYITQNTEHKNTNVQNAQADEEQSKPVSEETDATFTVESIGQILENTSQIRRLVYQQVLSLRDWCTLVSEFLQRVYASIIPKLSEVPEDETLQNESASESEMAKSTIPQDDTLDRKYHQVATGFLCVNASLNELASVPEVLSQAVTATEMLRLLLDQMKTQQLSSFHEPRSLCQVGWLDLRLDDSPHVLIAGMNEGVIPTSQTNDQFLPDSLRHHLHLEDNGRRFARDLYSLTTILKSRPDTLLLTSRRTIEGEPLRPSRLLFLTNQDNLPKRVCHLFSSGGPNDDKANTQTTVSPDTVMNTHTGFTIPSLRMPSPEPPSVLNVTAFRSFLSSPYAYFLKNGLGLEQQTDDDRELNAASFGNVLHEVVGRFASYHSGGRPVWDTTDADKIYHFLSWQLDDYMKNRFRQETSPAVAIQQEQIRNTLYHFSRWQALWRQNGNEILWVEKAPKLNVVFSAGGPPMRIYGRIDRIDYNRDTRTLYVFDYKTYSSSKTGNIQEADTLVRDAQTNTLLYSNATGNTVDDDHRVFKKKMLDRWTNLQLPLYYHIAKQLIRENRPLFTGETNIQTGYIMLLRNTQTTALGAPWLESDYENADGTIRWVIQTIRRLWPQEIRPND